MDFTKALIKDFEKKYLTNFDKRPVTELAGKHKGQVICVIGGGPTLPNDLKAVPPDAITIACNHHAHVYGMETDYLVFKDDPRKIKHLKEAIFDHRGILISTMERWTEYILNVPKFDRGFTGTLACWLACYMTDKEVILCGMDAYSSEQPYFHQTSSLRSWEHYKKRHFEMWSLAWGKVPHITGCPNPERIKVVSGPLIDVFSEYNTGDNARSDRP